MLSNISIPIIFSGLALLVSLISLVITLIQKRNETRRTIRKTLTDALEAIAKINIETTKLESNKDFSENDKTNLRRNYNSQRRILVAHGDFIATKYKNAATDIDCNILAFALSTIGDLERAEHYWEECVLKSKSNPIKLMNLRGFAMFLFRIGKFDQARIKFSEANSIELPDNDDNNEFIADTFCMAASCEKSINNKMMVDKNIENAMIYCNKIVNLSKQAKVRSQITDLI